MSQPPAYRGDHYWRKGDANWWDPEVLPVGDRPAVGYIPENFEGPSLAHDGINLGKFIKGNIAHVAPDSGRRSSTPLGGRSKYSTRLQNRGVVTQASPNRKNDLLTNNRRVPIQKLYMVPFATSGPTGFAIDQVRGQRPGTWFPCARNNNFLASPDFRVEETRNLWLFFSVLSFHNLNFADGILELMAYNLKNSPQDRVKYLDYFPHLERTSSTNRGYPCLAVCLESGPSFRIFNEDGNTEIDPGREKPKDNGILFVTHMDPDEMTIRSAQVIRYWDGIGTWPRRDKPFNAMIDRLINTVRQGLEDFFKPGVGETLAYYDARMAGQNPPSSTHPVTQLTDIAKNVRPPPARGHVAPNTRAARPCLFDAHYDPDKPGKPNPDEERLLKQRDRILEAMANDPPTPPGYYDSSSNSDDVNDAPSIAATTPGASNPEEHEDLVHEPQHPGRDDLGSVEFNESNEEAEVEAMVHIPLSASDSDDDDGNAAQTQTATTPASMSNSAPDGSEGGVEVDAEISNPTRQEDKEDNAPVSLANARMRPAELSDKEDEVEKAPPVRRSSRIPIRRQKFALPVEPEHKAKLDQEAEPVRKSKTRSAAQKKGTATAIASNNEEAPAAVRRPRTCATLTKPANTVINHAANVVTAPKMSKKIAAIEGKAAATTNTHRSNAVAGPGPSTIAMRRRKRNDDSNFEASKDEGRKQKKQKQM